ncbi:uncharacterized protein LOC128392245 [Panonychus citri]|uniref:uncharacterized protein LOC128392245 n=1 Tax=Panonychus citri TaxID=50023 RepID=UPI002307D1CA|nr:uncharacterized protein LOC128392245 [Panonychus citri]
MDLNIIPNFTFVVVCSTILSMIGGNISFQLLPTSDITVGSNQYGGGYGGGAGAGAARYTDDTLNFSSGSGFQINDKDTKYYNYDDDGDDEDNNGDDAPMVNDVGYQVYKLNVELKKVLPEY